MDRSSVQVAVQSIALVTACMLGLFVRCGMVDVFLLYLRPSELYHLRFAFDRKPRILVLVNFVHLTSFEYAIAPDFQLTSTLASSHALPRNPRSESKLRISIASNLHSGFVASKLRNPSFEFRLHQTSKPASSYKHSIQASESN